MPRRDDDRSTKLTTLAVMAAVVAVLYVASEVILPVALATLLTFLLSPLATRLERLGLGRVPSVLAVTALTFALLGGIGWVVVDQGIALTAELPKLQKGLTDRVKALKSLVERNGDAAGAAGRGDAGRGDAADAGEGLTETFNELAAELTGEETTEEGTPIVRGREPIPVEIVSTGPAALAFLTDWLGPLLAPLGTAAVVLVFVIFMLIQRDDLRDRFIRLSGTGRLAVTTQALDEAASRVSRYLLMLLIINGSYGLAVWLGLWL
ncbi:MAG TPA: AI-2E family transporter, partial [Planctomycetaceae bacterium]